ncbi:trypsin-like serine protease [Delftia acidovorans]
MSSSALHANNIYFSEDGLINLENSSLHTDGDLNGVAVYHICGSALISRVKVLTASHCLRHFFG